MKVFVNDIPFIFVDAAQQDRPGKDVATFASPSFSQIWRFYEMARDGQIQGHKGLQFNVNDYEGAVSQWKQRFLLLEAAGGIVAKGNQHLFIHRLGKWDLPKGKLEKGESPEVAGVREVAEECGVTAMISYKIGETWHTYSDRKGRNVLKCTHWYAMDCQNDEALKPQIEEDIHQVCWIPKEEVWEKALHDTYGSIREIYSIYEMKK